MVKTLIIFTLPFLIRIDVSLIRIGGIFYAMVEWVRFADVVVPCQPLTTNQGGGAVQYQFSCILALLVSTKLIRSICY